MSVTVACIGSIFNSPDGVGGRALDLNFTVRCLNSCTCSLRTSDVLCISSEVMQTCWKMPTSPARAWQAAGVVIVAVVLRVQRVGFSWGQHTQ